MQRWERMSSFVRAQRIQWLWHVERLNRDTMPKMVIYKDAVGKNRIGRPINRRLKKIQKDRRVVVWKAGERK